MIYYQVVPFVRSRAIWTPADLVGANGIYFDLRTDTYLTYGVSPAVASASPVRATGSLSGTNIAQATTSLQPQFSTRLDFDTADNLASNATAGAFNALHDTTQSSTIVLGFHIDTLNTYNCLWGTASGTIGTDIGALAFVYGTRLLYRLTDGSAVMTAQSAAGAISAGVDYVATIRKSPTNYDMRINSTSAASGAISNTSASNHTRAFALAMWGNAGGSYALDGKASELIFTDSWLSDADVATAEAYILAGVSP